MFKKSTFNKVMAIIVLLYLIFVAIVAKIVMRHKYSYAEPERSLSVLDSRTKIAIIDTGIDQLQFKDYLCASGHKDYTSTSLEDSHGHGTNVAGLIIKGLSSKKYCLLVYKYYEPNQRNNGLYSLNAWYEAIKQKADYINFSSGGIVYSPAEEYAINRALQNGIKVIVAAGNEATDLSKNCIYYPACMNAQYEGFYVVANCKNGHYVARSNYGGPAKQCEDGVEISAGGYTMSGTSQSAAIFTNRLIKNEAKKEQDK